MVLSPSDIAFEGFRIIRDRPALILAWTGFYLLSLATMILILLVPNVGALEAVETTGGSRDFDQLLARFGTPILIVFPLAMAMLTVLVAAIYRAVLRPQDKAWAYLRLGMDELRVFGVSLVLLIIFAITSAGYGVALVMLTEAAGPARGVLTFVGSIGGLVLLVWLAVRLSLAGATTFAEHGVRVFGPWQMTRNQFWRLLATLILTVVYALLVVAMALTLSLILARFSGGFSMLGELASPDLSDLTPAFALGLLAQLLLQLALQTLLIVLVFVIFYAPPAAAYRRLKAPSAPSEA